MLIITNFTHVEIAVYWNSSMKISVGKINNSKITK